MSHDSASCERKRPVLVSVIIPALNASDTIDDQLRGLATQSYRGAWELLIADNGSTDATVARCERWGDRIPNLRIIDASDRNGAGHARNRGAEAADGELLAFCDADDVVDSAWLHELVEASLRSDMVGGAVDCSDSLQVLMGFLPHATGGCMAVWRDAFERLGGFDERYLAAQDAEFSWRAQVSGITLGFAPAALIWRRPRRSQAATWTQHFRYGYWGALLYKEYRHRGIPRVRLVKWIARVVWLTVRFPYLAMSNKRRTVWIRSASYAVGAFAGSWAHRVRYLP